MKQFLLKLLMAGIFLILFSFKFTDVSIGERIYEHPLETAWEASGLKLQSITTESWMKLNDRWLTAYELKELANNIKEKLDLKTTTEVISGDQGELSYASFEGIQDDKTVITLTLQSSRSDYLNETQLGIHTVNNSKLKNLRQYLNGLKKTITGFSNSLSINFAIILAGEYHGKMGRSLVKEISGKMFRKLEAEQVDLIFENEGNIARGYSTLLSEPNTLQKSAFNIELTTIYDQSRNITEVVLASPGGNK